MATPVRRRGPTDPRRAQSPYIPSLRRQRGGRSYVPVDLPPAPMAPASPLGPQPEGGLPIRLPSEFAPQYGANPIVLIGDADIAPGAEAAVVSYQIPDAFRMRLDQIGFDADDETALTFLTWRIERQATRVDPYVSMPAALGSIRQPARIIFFSAGGYTVNIIASSSSSAGLTYRFICFASGWTYTEELK